MKLQGKVALVTGAGRCIGAANARQFAAEGAAVWVSDIDEAAATRVAQGLRLPAQVLNHSHSKSQRPFGHASHGCAGCLKSDGNPTDKFEVLSRFLCG